MKCFSPVFKVYHNFIYMQVNAVLLLRKKIISSLLKTLRFSFQNGALSVVPHMYIY